MLRTLSEEADACCIAQWEKAWLVGNLDTTTVWECPTCGCEYRATMVGPIEHWEYTSGARLIGPRQK